MIGAPTSGDVPLGPVLNQGDTSSCTGNSSALAIQARMPRMPDGSFAPLPSRLWLYYFARAKENDTAQDDGAQLADVFAAAAALGFPPESAWSFSEDLAKITAHPDYTAAFEAADQRLIKGAYRITTRGDQRVANVKAAIHLGHPVVWGTSLDEAFMDLGPTDVWPGLTGPSVGGHAMVLHRFDGDMFWTRSSWGEDYADGGSARITADAVASSAASDFWVVETAPKFSVVV